MVQGRTRQDNKVPDGMCWYMLVYTSIYWYILVYTSIYCAFRHKDFFAICKWIQHGTRQDRAVQRSSDRHEPVIGVVAFVQTFFGQQHNIRCFAL